MDCAGLEEKLHLANQQFLTDHGHGSEEESEEPRWYDREDASPRRFDVDGLHAAAVSLCSIDESVSSSGWPVQASAITDIQEWLGACGTEQRDCVLQVLVAAGIAEQLVQLLSASYNDAPALSPRELLLTRSTSVQFSVCQVSDEQKVVWGSWGQVHHSFGTKQP